MIMRLIHKQHVILTVVKVKNLGKLKLENTATIFK